MLDCLSIGKFRAFLCASNCDMLLVWCNIVCWCSSDYYFYVLKHLIVCVVHWPQFQIDQSFTPLNYCRNWQQWSYSYLVLQNEKISWIASSELFAVFFFVCLLGFTFLRRFYELWPYILKLKWCIRHEFRSRQRDFTICWSDSELTHHRSGLPKNNTLYWL